MSRLNVAVIGCGYWGPNLVRNVAQVSTATLHTICDINPARLQQIAAETRPLYTTVDSEAVFTNPEIDAVILATPADTHIALSRRTLQSGKHLLVEKPLALNSADCLELIALAEAQRRVLMVGHVFEYNPAVERLHELIHSETLGRVFYIYSTRVNLGQIRGDLNAFWNLGPHDISIINMLLGEIPVRVSGRGFSYLRPAESLEDVVFAILEYSSGITAHIHTSWLDPNKIRRMTIVGEKKMAVYDDISDHRITIYDKGAAWIEDAANYGIHRLQTFTGDIHVPKLPIIEPLRAEIEHFFNCILHNRQPRSDGQDGLNVVRVLESVTRSIQQGGIPVDL
jgi:predicted dehydrogenase